MVFVPQVIGLGGSIYPCVFMLPAAGWCISRSEDILTPGMFPQVIAVPRNPSSTLEREGLCIGRCCNHLGA